MHPDVRSITDLANDVTARLIEADRQAVERFLRDNGADPERHGLVSYPSPDFVEGRSNDRVLVLVPKELVPTAENGLTLTRKDACAAYPHVRLWVEVGRIGNPPH